MSPRGSFIREREEEPREEGAVMMEAEGQKEMLVRVRGDVKLLPWKMEEGAERKEHRWPLEAETGKEMESVLDPPERS